MGLLAGGSLMYEAPVPELKRYEPTGTFMSLADFEISFTNDGRNWQRANYEVEEDPPGIGFGVYAENYSVLAEWVFGSGNMVLPASFVNSYTFKMVSSGDNIRFVQSEDPPDDPDPDEENDEFASSVRLSFGNGGFIGTTTVQIRQSGNAEGWDEILPVDDDFGKAGIGIQRWMPEVGLHIRLGSGEFAQRAGKYWVSGAGTGWSELTFPEPFDSGIFQGTAVLAGNTDDTIVVGLQSNGRIYRSLDGVNWSLRFDPFPEEGVNSITWNPQANNGAGAFFATMSNFEPNPANLLTSSDGIFWNPVDPNDLPGGSFTLASDTGKNLMIARSDIHTLEPSFENGGYWMSDDDGETWKEFADRRGGFVGFIDAKIGPVIDETVFIDTGAIVISDSRNEPDTARASLFINAFFQDEGNLIQENTSRSGNLGLGLWALEQFPLLADTLNPFYYQIRLDGSGDAFRAFSRPINEWVDFNTGNSWGYTLDSGFDSKSFTGTLRIREKETLVESNSVSVSISAEVISGADLSAVVATPAVGTVGFIPHGEAAISGVEAAPAVGAVTANKSVEISGVEATPEVGTVTAT